jgi:hypothetical protein
MTPGMMDGSSPSQSKQMMTLLPAGMASSTGLQPVTRHVAGCEELHAPGPRVGKILRPGRADIACAHLNDAFDVIHLRGPAHGRGQTPAFSVNLVAPVDVGIDLDNGERAAAFKRLQHRDGDGVVAAEQHGHRTPVQHGRDG